MQSLKILILVISDKYQTMIIKGDKPECVLSFNIIKFILSTIFNVHVKLKCISNLLC